MSKNENPNFGSSSSLGKQELGAQVGMEVLCVYILVHYNVRAGSEGSFSLWKGLFYSLESRLVS